MSMIQNRANTIKDVIRMKPESGVELLLDFTKLYAIDAQVEDEALLILYQLNAQKTIENQEKEDYINQLLKLTDDVVLNYDEEKVNEKLNLEIKLKELSKERKLQDSVVLAAENIIRTYKSSNFNLECEKLELRLGEITGLVGENATGKTTLFKILAGELAQDKGALRYPLFDPNQNLSWADLKLKIAYVPQELPEWTGSLKENLQFEAARHGIKGKENDREVEYIIQRLGLAMHIDKSWSELSGGYKLRFALAKALVWRTQLLILDEPLAYLDIKTQMIVLNDLRDLAKSLKHPIAIIISSQHLHEIEAVADQMLFMRDGKLEHLGKVKEFNQDRHYNLFEINCNLSFQNFNKYINEIAPIKTWANGLSYFIETSRDMDNEKLWQFFAQHPENIKITYFRDISNSVKTKFYEKDL